MALEPLAPLLEPIAAVQQLLNRWNSGGLIIGGVAVSLLGQPRLTADVDAIALASLDDLPRLIDLAQQEGLEPRLPDAEAFARRSRVLLLRHSASGIAVDVSLGMLPFETEAVERGQLVQAGRLAIRLPTPEDLIILKAVAHRPKDLLDIQAVIRRYPNLDRSRIRHWVLEFAQALEMPELWDDIAGWL